MSSLSGVTAWVQFELAGGAAPFEVDRIEVDGAVKAPSGEPEIWACVVSGSDDGANWSEVGRAEGMARPSGDIRPSVKFHTVFASSILPSDVFGSAGAVLAG